MTVKMKIISMLTFVLLLSQAFAQGTLRGTILDETTGEALSGVNITNQEKNTGTISGTDGKFMLELTTGTHEIRISMIGYASLIQNVQIKKGW